ncbi:MAG: 2-oxo acid dehydrogenase subunit E2, partial [Lentisphaerae bacterium]|nr:2-oxo acid dehydrogenase subunit E2 [Lentisphaerota bacterium]
MAQAVLMPKLGQTVVEATIVSWHKKEGDPVKKGEVLFEVETDKAVLEAESFYEGVLLKILVGENRPVQVGTTVAFIGQTGEALPTVQEPNAATATPATTPKTPATAAPVVPQAETPQASPVPVAITPSTQPLPTAAPTRLFISPRAKALAREKAIEPSGITGSGPNGRIVVKDVEYYLTANNYDKLKISPAAKKMAVMEHINILTVRGTGNGNRIMVDDIKRAIAEKPQAMTKMRQVIAKRLTDSFTTTPHFYATVAVDMTNLLIFRQELKEQGSSFTVTDFILEAVVLSLQEFPALNSVTDGATVRWHSSIDLGMAVGLEQGLVVPAIRNADNLSMQELHNTAATLAKKAREGKLLPDEMTGSTFTVSNMGMLGVDSFSAIINPGESAILAVSSTIAKPAVVNNEIKIRNMMNIT